MRGGRVNFPGLASLLAATAALLLVPQAANAASGGAASEVIFLAQIMLLIFVGRLMGEAMQRIGQPAVTGQLLAGIFLGPTVFGFFFPETRAWLDDANAAIMDAVNRTGEMFLSHTRLRDRFTIRVAIGNLRTEPRHVERAWVLLREAAARLDPPQGDVP